MKTAKEIQAEIAALENEGKRAAVKESAYKKLGKQAAVLRQCLHYLETNPKEDFIRTQIEFVEKKLRVVDEGYSTWARENDTSKFKNPLSAYHSFMGKSVLDFQLKSLKYILN